MNEPVTLIYRGSGRDLATDIAAAVKEDAEFTKLINALLLEEARRDLERGKDK